MPILQDILCAHQRAFRPVVPINPGKDRLVLLDFTDSNPALTNELIGDINAFSDYVTGVISAKQARYGIGGYGELRGLYRRSEVFDGEEPRRLHLGTDIWGPAGTAVMAPLAGQVHSFAFNNRLGDYGATILLRHELEGNLFYTLYGHLNLAALQGINEGMVIEGGQLIAEFGTPAENGYWPPHLHFQLIIDPEGWKGDYPGVCRLSEKEQYLKNCPDPDWVLGFNQFI